ncbi:hypothetical protein GHT06_019652 [Daphnia sinensis]|uniref:Uncharacterized protein n=1 Tax=Daphnia sinensis TaxID=1820382 RepID=A0AAD5L182_9CRUS|nr:hypothetical protein GHT06_019652 [Daphnia sinensis]
MDSIDLAKVISMIVLSLGTLILGLLPIWIIRRMKVQSGSHEMSPGIRNVLSGMLCFGGGVLMATALTHLLPELHEGITELQADGTIKSSLPIAEIIFSAGFFLVYLIEELVHVIIHRRSHHRKKADVSIHQSVGITVVQPIQPDELEDGCNEKTICQSNCDDLSTPSTNSGSDQAIVDNISITSKKRTASVVHHHDHHHHVMADSNRTLPSVQGLLIIIGLSLHEILEGVAIGLEETEGDVWGLFAAVATHKFVITFCVGLDMASNGVKPSLQICYMIVLSLVSSIGIGVGMALSNGTSVGLVLTSLILQGLAGGTLIYVAFFEVLERERTKPSNKLMQWATVLLGYLFMIGLEALIPEHEHGEHEEHGTEDPHLRLQKLATVMAPRLLGFHGEHDSHNH